MAVTGQMQLASVVTALAQDAWGGASIENGPTVLQGARRQRALQCVLGTTATLCGRQEPDHIDRHALSTCHHPLP
jgi:hypothetical protein